MQYACMCLEVFCLLSNSPSKSNRDMVHSVYHPNFALCYLSLDLRKPVLGVSDQARHKLGCAVTEDG